MVTLPVEFYPFNHVHIGDLFGLNGIYVIWDAHAVARPTYIGEGNVLVRFGAHARRDARKFARPLDGYIALLDDTSRRSSKLHVAAVERLLLDVARDTDRDPTVNVHPGRGSVIRELCREGTLRVNVHGYDPLSHPRSARPIAGSKRIQAWRTDGGYEFEHDWRFRRIRQPIV